MPKEIIITEAAYESLDGIFLYVAQRDGKERALKLYEKLVETFDRLLTFPDSGSIPRIKEIAEKGYRFVTQSNIIAFYLQANENIYITTILHGSQDYSKKKF